MRKNTPAAAHDLEDIAEDARALLAATGHVAEEKVIEARKRLNEALDRTKDAWERLEERTTACVKSTDGAIREHPYQSIGIAFGVGAVIGYLLARRN